MIQQVNFSSFFPVLLAVFLTSAHLVDMAAATPEPAEPPTNTSPGDSSWVFQLCLEHEQDGPHLVFCTCLNVTVVKSAPAASDLLP